MGHNEGSTISNAYASAVASATTSSGSGGYAYAGGLAGYSIDLLGDFVGGSFTYIDAIIENSYATASPSAAASTIRLGGLVAIMAKAFIQSLGNELFCRFCWRKQWDWQFRRLLRRDLQPKELGAAAGSDKRFGLGCGSWDFTAEFLPRLKYANSPSNSCGSSSGVTCGEVIPGQEYTGVWRESEWSECSGACDGGSGTRERGVTCQGGNFLCDPDTQPDASEACVNNTPCCTSWSEWTCSASCGNGTETRRCLTGPATGTIGTGDSCSRYSQSACCGSWEDCSETCGGGTQTRTCQSNLSNYSTSRGCNTHSCHTHSGSCIEPYFWNIACGSTSRRGTYSGCGHECGDSFSPVVGTDCPRGEDCVDGNARRVLLVA